VEPELHPKPNEVLLFEVVCKRGAQYEYKETEKCHG
jgi:hypothetical protein